MGKRKTVFLIAVLIFASCSFGHRAAVLNCGNNLSMVLYTDPSTDCVACNLIVLRALNKIRGKNICIIIIRTEDSNEFQKFLHIEGFNFKTKVIEKPLKGVLHPSFLILKNNNIMMYLYIHNSPTVLKEIVSESQKFLKLLGI